MIGAFLAGAVYARTRCGLKAVAGEVFGTGILGALLAFPVARFLLGRDVAALFFVVPFLASSSAGAVLGYLLTARFSDGWLKQKIGE